MIRKGTPLSRLVALSVIAGPMIIAAMAFTIWAVSAWSRAGDRIAEASAALHRIDARRSQAELYGPLGDSWTEYARSAASGLVLDRDVDAAARALVARVETLLMEAHGFDPENDAPDRPRIPGAVSLINVEPAGAGIELLRAEARGILPQATLPRFLDGLESGEPFIFVEYLDIRRAPDDADRAMVEVRLRFSAYRLVADEPLPGGDG